MPRYNTRLHRRRTHAAHCIQRAWKRHSSRDPITLERLSRPVFVHVDVHSGAETLWSPRSLAKCIETTGDYRNPLTRQRFSSPEIMRLERLARLKGARYELHANMQRYERRRRLEVERRELLDYLAEDTVGVADAMCELLHDHERSLRDVITRMQTVLFPMFQTALLRVHSMAEDESPVILTRVDGMLARPFVHGVAALIARSFMRATRMTLRTGGAASADLFHPYLRLMRRIRPSRRLVQVIDLTGR